MVFHLRDKLAAVGPEALPLLSDEDAEVIDALTALGFSIVEAQSALQHLEDREASLEDKVRQALAYLAP
jgi:Holliday junction DNA helicase RuvA